MSLSCREALDALPGYAAETLDSEIRQSLRDHVATCGDCREVAVHTDPGMLFNGSAPISPTTDEEVAQILAGVRAGIAWRQAERKLSGNTRLRRGTPPSPRARRRGVAAAAAAAVVALALLVPASTPRRGPRAVSNLSAPRVPAQGLGQAQAQAQAETQAQAQAQASGPVVPAARPASLEVPASKFPADATIYDLSKGVGEPRVVWIVDRSLDI
jgi:Putative zinc-finger